MTTLATAKRPILLLGANGQLGRALQPRLAALGDLVIASRQDIDLADPACYGCGAAGAAGTLAALIQKLQPSAIVNAAAYTAVDKAESETELAALVNTEAPKHLAAAAAALGIPFIHYSTDYVFPGTAGAPWREDDATAPLNVYGQTKLAGEAAALASGAAAVILRTSWVFSAAGTNFLRTMLRVGATQPSLRVVADQIGAPTSADFLAEATVQILRVGHAARDWQSLRGIYHLSCAGETSWHGFATEIFAAARRHGLPLAVRDVQAVRSDEYPQIARRPHNSRLDNSRFSQVFSLPRPSWQAATDLVVGQLAEASS